MKKIILLCLMAFNGSAMNIQNCEIQRENIYNATKRLEAYAGDGMVSATIHLSKTLKPKINAYKNSCCDDLTCREEMDEAILVLDDVILNAERLK